MCCSILRKLTDKRVHCVGLLPANSTAVADDRRDSALRVLLEVRNYEHDKEELENLRQKFKSRTIIDMDFQIVPASYGSYCFEEETEDWEVQSGKRSSSMRKTFWMVQVTSLVNTGMSSLR